MRWHGTSTGQTTQAARAHRTGARREGPRSAGPSIPEAFPPTSSSRRRPPGRRRSRFGAFAPAFDYKRGILLMLSTACADALHDTRADLSRFQAPPSQGGSAKPRDSHQSRPGYRNRATTLISRTLVRGDQRDRCRGCSPISQVVVHVRPIPSPGAAGAAAPRSSSASRASRCPPPRRPPRSTSAPPSRSSSSPAPPPRTPGPRCSTATSASRPARRSSASACPPSSTAPRTPPTPSPRKAQLDLTTAYDVAAGQPVSPANDLTGTDLGNRDPQGRRLPLHVVGPAHRPAHARRRGRSERAVRVRDRHRR